MTGSLITLLGIISPIAKGLIILSILFFVLWQIIQFFEARKLSGTKNVKPKSTKINR